MKTFITILSSPLLFLGIMSLVIFRTIGVFFRKSREAVRHDDAPDQD